MKLQITDLTTERKWRAATGTTQQKFTLLLDLFTASYLTLYGQTVAQRQTGSTKPASLPSEQELLFFTLFSLKANLTYDLLGLVCGMDGTNAQRNQQLGLQVLQHTLQQAACLPVRQFATPEEFTAYFQSEAELLLDGVEQRVQRPHQYEVQKEFYSGKRNVIR